MLQCPPPSLPDSRLLEPACDYQLAGADPADTLAIGTITHNNACARQNRARYQELQRWTKEQRNVDSRRDH